MNEIKNYGLVISPVKDERDFVLGGGNVPKVVLRPNGDWTDIPDKEIQQRRFETFNCTSFNTLAEVEKLVYVLTGERVNYSDRFLGTVAGTKPPGNDPTKVAQALRHFGCIPEEMMPFSDDLQNTDEYYSFKGVDKEKCLAEGRKWLEKFNFMHEWVFSENDLIEVKRTNMLEALTFSPIAMAVYAWEKKGDVYVDGGHQPNHWTGNVKGVLGKKWIANDSYIDTEGDTLKDLDWNFKFAYPKRYFLELKNVTERKIGLIQSLINLLKQMFQFAEDAPVLVPTALIVDETLPKPSVVDFAKAIQAFEGWFPPSSTHPNGSVSWRSKNPGNIKYQGGGFMKFESEEKGFAYLCEYIKRVQQNKHSAYPKDCDIKQFFLIYAPPSENHSLSYAVWVAHKLGIRPDYKIKDLV